MITVRLLVSVSICLAALSASASAERSDAQLGEALKSGRAFAIMRHAIAPGFSDPDNFDVDDCATQRNLSDEGRDQARRIGKWFKSQDINAADVFASQWCRCRDTAELLGLGPVDELPPLNSFFEAREQREPQTAALKRWLKSRLPIKRPLVLVTHQVNISALVGRSTRSGETLVVGIETDSKEYEVLGGFVQ